MHIGHSKPDDASLSNGNLLALTWNRTACHRLIICHTEKYLLLPVLSQLHFNSVSKFTRERRELLLPLFYWCNIYYLFIHSLYTTTVPFTTKPGHTRGANPYNRWGFKSQLTVATNSQESLGQDIRHSASDCPSNTMGIIMPSDLQAVTRIFEVLWTMKMLYKCSPLFFNLHPHNA